MDWSTDQVLALAPDEGSIKASRKLVSPAQWEGLGKKDVALWGKCRGSGSKPYLVRVDLREPAFRCSCPSRKFPCKHALALLLLYAENNPAVREEEIPGWVGEWLEQRAQRGRQREEKAKKKGQPPDPEARAKRIAGRREKNLKGMHELSLRLRDAVRSGLASERMQSYSYWDEAARRLIDAQAPSVARAVHELGGISPSTADDAVRALKRMGSLALLYQAVQGLDNLDENRRQDVLAELGWTIPREELLQQEGLEDRWQVLAASLEEDDINNLWVSRAWLEGRSSRRVALVLEYSPRNQPAHSTLLPGSEFDGRLVFYPGAYPLRALVKERGESHPSREFSGYDSFEQALDSFSEALARNPWLEQFPMPMKDVIPVISGERWLLVDRERKAVPLAPVPATCWRLLAGSGGRPIDVFGEWYGGMLRPCLQDIIETNPSRPHATGFRGLLADLARCAMLGSENSTAQPPAMPGALDEMISHLDPADPEWKLLLSAGLASVYEKAGLAPETGESLEIGECEPDPQPVCSKGGAALLRRMLNGEFSGVLPEALELLCQTERSIPPSLLPDVLDLGVAKKDLRGRILASGRERVRWLASFNERWAYATGGDSEVPEVEGDLSVQREYLVRIRRESPERGRELLAERISGEPSATRLELLTVLEEGLGIDDEEFLESLLDDRSKRLRRLAAEYLSAIPGSRLGGRMTERMGNLVSKKRRALRSSLSIEIPETLEEAMKRDGIEEEPARKKNIGRKASWLLQLVELTPLTFWEKHVDPSADKVVKLLQRTEWSEAVLGGMVKAAMRQRDHRWLDVLMDQGPGVDLLAELPALLSRLPERERETVLLKMLRTMDRGMKTLYPFCSALETCTRIHSAELAREILRWMRAVLANGKHDPYLLGPVRQAFQAVALAIPRSLIPEAMEGWPTGSAAWERIAATDENFHAILRFRMDLYKEFR